MRFLPLLAYSAVVSCALVSPSRAQLADLVPGARIRLQSPTNGDRVDGTIIARGPDSITVATLRGKQYQAALNTVRSVDLYRGRSRIVGAKKGAFWGAVIAAVPLVIAYAAANPKRDRWSRADELRFSAFVLKVYAETGAVIGAFVGADSWQRCVTPTAPTCGSHP